MRSEFTLFLRAISVSMVLALFGCDDGNQPGDPGGSGGEGGEAGAGGTAGSSGTGGEGGDAGSGGEAGMGGSNCGDCPRELVCGDDSECVEVSPCENDLQCLEGNICVEEECVAGCQGDDDCAGDSLTPYCSESRCRACTSDEQCFGASTCDLEIFDCVEPDACTDSRECAGDRICANGSCEAPFDCNDADSSCDSGYICTEAGECIIDPDAGCETTADCAVIGHVCRQSSRPSRCGPCEENGDCSDGQTCVVRAEGNICREPDVCATDDECLGGRICTEGACVAPPCEPDGLEDNDDAASAQPIIAGLLRSLTSCAGDDDWYVFTLPEGNAANVILRQTDAQGDLEFSLFNEREMLLVTASTNQPTERAIVGPYIFEQQIFIRVGQVGLAASAGYTLDVTLVDEIECVDDPFEAGAGDDTPETARRVRGEGELGFSGAMTGRICAEDDDFFCFHANSRERLSAHVDINGGDAVIAGELLDSDGQVVAEGRWSRRGESQDLVLARSARGTYCLRLFSESGSGSYEVELGAVNSAVLEACEGASPLALANGSGSALGQLTLDSAMTPSCAAAEVDGGESVYSVEIGPEDGLPLLLTARVTGLVGGTLGDPAVSIRSDCQSALTELGCSTGSLSAQDPLFPQVNPAVARVAIEEPGTYAIIVDGTSVGARANYQLEVETSPLARAPRNDSCEDADNLAFDPNGVRQFSVNLDRASTALAGCQAVTGPDAVYQISFVDSAYVRVQASASGDDFPVGAFLTQACDDASPLYCGFGFEGWVEAGDYHLVIKGADANSRGRVSFQVDVETPLGQNANETCEDALVLAPEGGEMVGDTRTAADDYRLVDANLCTGHNSLGGDLVYAVAPQESGRFFVEASPQGGWDLSLYVTTGCDNPARNRVDCSDGALTESVVFEPQGVDAFYVIVDGSNGEAGPFNLRWGTAECRLDVDCAEGSCVDYQCVAE